MKILTEGHRYELANFEKKEQVGQQIQFIQKEPKVNGSPELITISDGTTNEEVPCNPGQQINLDHYAVCRLSQVA